MTRALLDINVLLALLDSDHIEHARAGAWIDAEIGSGWASCAITQNGFVRVISQPRYPSPVSPAEAIDLLDQACAEPHHVFWPCDVSLLDATRDRPHPSAQPPPGDRRLPAGVGDPPRGSLRDLRPVDTHLGGACRNPGEPDDAVANRPDAADGFGQRTPPATRGSSHHVRWPFHVEAPPAASTLDARTTPACRPALARHLHSGSVLPGAVPAGRQHGKRRRTVHEPV